MEVVTLGYFAVHAVLTLALGSPFLKTYGAIANSLVLAFMAFSTLAMKNPFTYQYAKEDWDKSYWTDPAFIRINEIITGVWGGIFLFNTFLGALAVFVFPERGLFVMLLLTVILPNVGVVAGIVFSSVFPGYASRQSVKARLDAWDPYKWAAPKFNGRPAAETEHDVIVVGSGIGGLSAAALLAKRGLKVAVFEQHYLPGGYCTAWERHVKPPSGSPQDGGSQRGVNAGRTSSTQASTTSADWASAAESAPCCECSTSKTPSSGNSTSRNISSARPILKSRMTRMNSSAN
jgi:hypothetical protein